MGNSCCGWDDDEDVAEEALKRKIVCGDVNNVENLQQNFASNEVITSKYTVLNFLPKNLYEQFRRVANFYFLIILCIELIPGVSPFMPITSILPLAFVIAVSAVKEAWEDYLRHQNDHRNNSVECRRITKANGKDNVQAVEKRSLRVGDLVMVFENEEFPADLILLTSQRTDGHCYIETANLDGEVNLKDKSVVISGATAEGPIQMCGGANMTAIHQAIGGSVLECDVPNVELYKFDGTFKFADGSLRGTCSADSLLLRGANLRKTQWVIGLVVFTGKESKIIMNMMPGRNKMSSVEYQLNRFVLSIFFFMTFMCIVCTILCIAWKVQQGKHMWYLGSIVVVTELKVLLFDFLTFVILFNMMIPISLMVSVECVKVINSQLVESDLKMWHTKLNKGCSVNTSNLLEELAQVQYVFSDKTGTLTENIMVFKRCSVSIPARTGREVPTTTVKYSVDKDQTCGAEVQLMNEDSARHSVELRDFLLGLALCNTTTPEKDKDGNISYLCESPDEEALVAGAAKAGIVLEDSQATEMTVSLVNQTASEQVKFGKAITCKFDSTRKRMSQFVKTPNGGVRLYIKGAESFMFPILLGGDAGTQPDDDRDNDGRNDKANIDNIKAHINEYATLGLRTLLVGYRDFSNDEYQAIERKFMDANRLGGSAREDAIQAMFREAERDILLLGCTAIEDKLQEDVGGTIASMLDANIKVWMLTGDKQETAINIGYSTRLISDTMEKLIVNAENPDQCRKLLKKNICLTKNDTLDVNKAVSVKIPGVDRPVLKQPKPEYCLIIDGKTLDFALQVTDQKTTGSKKDKSQVIETTQITTIVTTNRLNVATQHQEQDILIINKNNNNRSLFVRLAKDCKSVICCRVSPLQKALVVRLMKEALAKPVTLSIGDGANDVTMIQEAHIGVGIRGREGTQAASTADYAIAQFKFLRRLLLVHGRWSYLRISTLIQYSLYKNMTLMLPMFYFASFSGYSGQSFMDGMLLTFFNIIYTCTPILCYAVFEQDISDEEAMNNPHLYKHFQACGDFDAKSFLYWMLSALWHSIVVYYGTIFLCRDDVLDAGGRQVGLWAQGMIGLTLIIIIVTLKLALETGYWTLINHINTWGSLIVFFLFLPLYSVYLTYEAPDAYYSAQILAGSGAVWLGLISLPILALLPDYVCKAHQRAFDPLPWQVYHERALKKRTRAPQTIIEEDDADAEAELAAKKPSGEKKPLLATDDASS
eukprot:gnl/Hemi2/3765_TR1319_c0_g1_i2.p1 gnl/Hemi2/3765_TR1319_c0_g1~~gnl/Hemi2/3765_TR1319_c0_g1_i2.p1  ORF type:complete len:1221 (-),score=437.48 gnl/Hemi2/3765_TR1319_c0_g1_i2:298-3960(-)